MDTAEPKIAESITILNNLQKSLLAEFDEVTQALQQCHAIRAKLNLSLLESPIDTPDEYETVYWSINRRAPDKYQFGKYWDFIFEYCVKFEDMSTLFDYAYVNSDYLSTFHLSILTKFIEHCESPEIAEWVTRPSKWQYMDDYWHDCDPEQASILEDYFQNGYSIRAFNDCQVRRVHVIL